MKLNFQVKLYQSRAWFWPGGLLLVFLSLFSCNIIINITGEVDKFTEGDFLSALPPSGLSVQSVGPGDVVNLIWNAHSATIDGYKLYVDTVPAVTTASTLLTTQVGTTFTHPVAAGTTYYFAVLAYQGATESPLSAVLTYAISCGNGHQETGEACDDGNLVYGDGCSPICVVEVLDVTPPTLSTLSISGTPTGAGGKYAAGDQATISWTVTDDISGYGGAGFYLVDGQGLNPPVLEVTGLTASDYSYTVTVPEVVNATTYYPAIIIQDNAGNRRGYYVNVFTDVVNLVELDVSTDPPTEVGAVAIPFVGIDIEAMAWPPATSTLVTPDLTLYQKTLNAGEATWYRVDVTSGNTYNFYMLDADNAFSWAASTGLMSIYRSTGTVEFEGLNSYSLPYTYGALVTETIYIQIRDAGTGGNLGFLALEHFGAGFCGDSILNTGESCDDGNTTGGDGCSAFCDIEPVLNLSASGTAITLRTHPLIRGIWMYWYHAVSGKVVFTLGSQTTPGIWDFTFPETPAVENGNWLLASLNVDDLLSQQFQYSPNVANYEVSYLGNPADLTSYPLVNVNVTGSTPDIIPPTLISSIATPGTYTYGDTLRVEVDASDAGGAGIGLVVVTLEDENGVSYGDELAYFDATSGKYIADVWVQGAFFVNRPLYPAVRIFENAGNNIRFYYNPLVTLTNFTANTEPPTVDSDSGVVATPVTLASSPTSVLTLGNPYTLGNLTNYGNSLLYQFTSTPLTSHTIFWDDSKEGSGSTTVDVMVSIYDAAYQQVGGGSIELDSGFTTGFTFISPAGGGDYFIEVRSQSGSGDFKIRVQ